MKRLADALEPTAEGEMYRSLLASEARHFHGYVDMAIQLFGRVPARERLHALAEHEAVALISVEAVELPIRLHSAAGGSAS